ncbi:MAG: hypothetical protein LC798_03255 [Chloroflexi bacterium]|nr:hypothetical protein [Chloroflexota bacterium]
MSQAITHVQPTAPAAQEAGALAERSSLGVTEAEAKRMWATAKVLANSKLVSPVLQGNPEAIMGVGLHLVALGIPFTLVGLKQVHVWTNPKRPDEGVQMQLHYQAHVALMARAGHDAWLEELDDTHATVKVVRGDTGREQSFTYTMDMAKRARLTEKENWQKHPHYMLPARAAVMAARFACPDALIGLDPDTDSIRVRPIRPPEPGQIAGESMPPAPPGAREEQAGSDSIPGSAEASSPPPETLLDARRAAIKARLEDLDDEEAASLHEWMTANDIPPLDHPSFSLDDAQAIEEVLG